MHACMHAFTHASMHPCINAFSRGITSLSAQDVVEMSRATAITTPPTFAAACPSTARSQSQWPLLPEAFVVVSAGHAEHDVLPATDLYEPTTHGMHAAVVRPGEKPFWQTNGCSVIVQSLTWSAADVGRISSRLTPSPSTCECSIHARRQRQPQTQHQWQRQSKQSGSSSHISTTSNSTSSNIAAAAAALSSTVRVGHWSRQEPQTSICNPLQPYSCIRYRYSTTTTTTFTAAATTTSTNVCQLHLFFSQSLRPSLPDSLARTLSFCLSFCVPLQHSHLHAHYSLSWRPIRKHVSHDASPHHAYVLRFIHAKSPVERADTPNMPAGMSVRELEDM